jgi:hypothetical protein
MGGISSIKNIDAEIIAKNMPEKEKQGKRLMKKGRTECMCCVDCLSGRRNRSLPDAALRVMDRFSFFLRTTCKI